MFSRRELCLIVLSDATQQNRGLKHDEAAYPPN